MEIFFQVALYVETIIGGMRVIGAVTGSTVTPLEEKKGGSFKTFKIIWFRKSVSFKGCCS